MDLSEVIMYNAAKANRVFELVGCAATPVSEATAILDGDSSIVRNAAVITADNEVIRSVLDATDYGNDSIVTVIGIVVHSGIEAVANSLQRGVL